MFYEDVKVLPGDTVSTLAASYGYQAIEWPKIWGDSKNSSLAASHGRPEALRASDTLFIPIPWTIVVKRLAVETNGVGFTVQRNGARGTRLSWVQTVYQHNQPVAGTTPFCVDGCPADDELPFYWTAAELSVDPTHRRIFIDHPQRPSPGAATRTTRWRAIVSIAVVTGKRVTVYNSTVWGFNRAAGGAVSKIGPRDAKPDEIVGHLHLLRIGKSTGAGSFGQQGWTFRSPPRN